MSTRHPHEPEDPSREVDETRIDLRPIRSGSRGSENEEGPSGHGHRVRWAWLGVLSVVVGGAVVLGVGMFMAVRDQVAPGTHIAGIDVGGMKEAELLRVIDGPLTQKLQRPVIAAVGTGSVVIDPVSVGIRLDRRATLERLLSTRPGNVLAPFRALSGQYRDITPVLTMDRPATARALKQELLPVTQRARDASVTTPDPSPRLTEKGDASFSATSADITVEPAVTGRIVKVGPAVTVLHDAVESAATEVRFAVRETKPSIPTEEAEKVDQLIGTFTTEHPCCAPRVTNIHRIAEIVDGSQIAPGATFSLNAAAGRRTVENGFVDAPAIAEGELVDQVGGGVSQFSTTLYNAAWFSGLEILKHQPHSKYISRYPPGREATLDFDTIDQVIRNDTDAPVVIRASTTATSVTVALYGHTGNREVRSTTGPQNPRAGGGFSVSVVRRIIQEGAVTGTDTTSWTYTGLD